MFQRMESQLRSNILKIVKLGGSVISDKSKPFSFRTKVVQRIAYEIREYLKAFPQCSLIMVHGGGSFGHPLVKEYNLQKGLADEKSLEGASLTNNAMRELCMKISKILIKAGLHVFPLQTSALFMREYGTKFIGAKIVKETISKGFIPLLHGDLILDSATGVSVLSGDEIIVHLASTFKPLETLFIVDVDGIYVNIDGKRKWLHKITLRELDNLISYMEPIEGYDVTGGMLYKLSQVRELLKICEKVKIVNGLRKRNVFHAFAGDVFKGTIIVCEG